MVNTCCIFLCFSVDGYSIKSAVDIAGEVCSIHIDYPLVIELRLNCA